jgi:hypothetical protein
MRKIFGKIRIFEIFIIPLCMLRGGSREGRSSLNMSGGEVGKRTPHGGSKVIKGKER